MTGVFLKVVARGDQVMSVLDPGGRLSERLTATAGVVSVDDAGDPVSNTGGGGGPGAMGMQINVPVTLAALSGLMAIPSGTVFELVPVTTGALGERNKALAAQGTQGTQGTQDGAKPTTAAPPAPDPARL